MKGFDVNFKTEDCVEEFSRRLILPEKLTFKELEKIILTSFSFSGERYSEFALTSKNIDGDSSILIDDYITQIIIYEFDWTSKFVSEDGRDNWRVSITLNKSVGYDKNYASLISYTGEAVPPEGSGGINGFNNMLLNSYDLKRIDPPSIQKDLCNIKSVQSLAYIVKIKSEKSRKTLWREFLIPEKTTFFELEKIIIVSFDTIKVSFEADGAEVVDRFMRKSKFYSKDRDFSVELKKTIYSKRKSPILTDFKGGTDPFMLWHEYYPDEALGIDESQSSLDAYFK